MFDAMMMILRCIVFYRVLLVCLLRQQQQQQQHLTNKAIDDGPVMMFHTDNGRQVPFLLPILFFIYDQLLLSLL